MSSGDLATEPSGPRGILRSLESAFRLQAYGPPRIWGDARSWMPSLCEEAESRAAVEDYRGIALRTFALGLFRKVPDDAEESGWECSHGLVEMGEAAGLTTLVCGAEQCLAVSASGGIYRWSCGDCGLRTLSRGFVRDTTLTDLERDRGCLDGQHLRDVALAPSGGSSSSTAPCFRAVALMDSGAVYLSEAGPGSVWHEVACLRQQSVLSVACGKGFCVALSATGGLWTWGESRYGALGLGEVAGIDSLVASPTPIIAGLSAWQVCAIACGEDHMLAAAHSDNGTGCDHCAVFSWGCGSDHRLGYDIAVASDWVQHTPRQVQWITEYFRGSQLVCGDGRSSPSRPARARRQILQLGCGARHSVVLGTGGRVLCFGANDHGQLGLLPALGELDETRASLPSFVGLPFSGSEPVRRICCGPLHNAAVCGGHLYLWGLDIARQPSSASSSAGVGARRVDGFGPGRPIIALGCGPHFVLVSAEVEVPSHAHTAASPSSASRRSSNEKSTASSSSGAPMSFRPSNLPPKQSDEARRHQQQVFELERVYQRHLVEDRKREVRQREREEKRERRLREHTEIWMTRLLPAYVPGARPQRAAEKLWRQGLPPRVREVLWPLAIGNGLRITPELYEINLQRAMDAREHDGCHKGSGDDMLGSGKAAPGREGSVRCITLDLPRTFPTLAFFWEGGPLYEDWTRILEAYTFFRPDIGYVQGMSFLAAMLLICLAPYPAFVALCNLINSPSILGLYRLDAQAVDGRSRIFRMLCAAQLPSVARHLDDIAMGPEMFLLEWFLTLYSKCLSLDVASVVWDLFLLDGEVVLYSTALALLGLIAPALLEADLEQCRRLLGADLHRHVFDADELLLHVHEARRQIPDNGVSEIQRLDADEFAPMMPAGVGFSAQPAERSLPGELMQRGLSALARMAPTGWSLRN